MAEDKVVVIDFGGQYNQLIARRVRQCHVYSEVLPYTIDIDTLKDESIKGIIFTGGPNSVYDEKSPHIDKRIFELGKPILGICYGAQLIAYELGGKVEHATKSEYGKTIVHKVTKGPLMNRVNDTTEVFMSHTDQVTKIPEGFELLCSSDNCRYSAFENVAKNIYATQFHPEVEHSVQGQRIIENFVLDICRCNPSWKPSSFIDMQVEKIREKVGDKKVI
ncbi:MAG: glutamine-hydrolyzing GMP synthase, partial [Bacilli bacterium]